MSARCGLRFNFWAGADVVDDRVVNFFLRRYGRFQHDLRRFFDFNLEFTLGRHLGLRYWFGDRDACAGNAKTLKALIDDI